MGLKVLPPGSPPAIWTAFARQAAWREWVIAALIALNALTIVAAVRVARKDPDVVLIAPDGKSSYVPRSTANDALLRFLAEVNLLRFGVDQLAPVAKASQRLAAASTIRVTPELQSPSNQAGEAGPPSLVPEGFPASEMAGCTGLEFSRGDLANRATTHANSSIRSKAQQLAK